MQPTIWIYDNGAKFNSDADKVKQAFPDMADELTANPKVKFLYQKQQSIADWYGAKYRVEWMSRDRNGGDDGVNFPIIRLGDVMLMAAEATLGDVQADGSAKPTKKYGVDGPGLFKQIRDRAKASTDKPLTAENLMEERKLELTGEYVRKFDLMRWGILHTAMKEAKARLERMDKHEGEFEGLQDTVYFKYTRCDDYVYEAGIKGFVQTDVFGLKKGEKGKPVAQEGEVWIKSNIYESSSSGRQLASVNYMLYDYDNEKCLLGKQYWPIFATSVGSSNGALWNDYMYATETKAE